jgi:hypothetical protein
MLANTHDQMTHREEKHQLQQWVDHVNQEFDAQQQAEWQNESLKYCSFCEWC